MVYAIFRFWYWQTLSFCKCDPVVWLLCSLLTGVARSSIPVRMLLAWLCQNVFLLVVIFLKHPKAMPSFYYFLLKINEVFFLLTCQMCWLVNPFLCVSLHSTITCFSLWMLQVWFLCHNAVLKNRVCFRCRYLGCSSSLWRNLQVCSSVALTIFAAAC